MGAAESRQSNNTIAGASGGTSRPKKNPNDEEPETPSSLAVVGAIGAAAVGAGLLAWKMSRPATTETPTASGPSTFLEYCCNCNGGHGMDDVAEYCCNCNGGHGMDDVANMTQNGGEWKPPAVGLWMLNVDGSHVQGVQGGVGGVLRDHLGDPIMAFACAFMERDASFHELQAIRVGLELVGSLQHRRPIIVATDSADAARLLQDEEPRNRLPAVQQVVKEIKEMMNRMGISKPEKISRSSNQVADRLSRECRWIGRGKIWFWIQNPPKQITLKDIIVPQILQPETFPENARMVMDAEKQRWK